MFQFMVSLRKGCNKRGGYPQHIEQRRVGAATRWGIASEKQGLQVRGVQCMLGNSDWQRQKLGIWGLFFYKRLFLSDYFCIFSSEFLWFFGNTNTCRLHHKPCMYCKQPFSLSLSLILDSSEAEMENRVVSHLFTASCKTGFCFLLKLLLCWTVYVETKTRWLMIGVHFSTRISQKWSKRSNMV